jgi:hypothetical protein
MTQKSINWSRKQLLVAFNLYCQLPFGRMHSKNPDIIRFADLIGRTPSALAMKLTNIASLDPIITSSGRRGLSGASSADKAMWDEMQRDWEHFAIESQTAVDSLLGETNSWAPDEQLTISDFALDERSDYSSENRSSQTQVRIGQQFFRRAVISAYAGRCCITGLAQPVLLVASHIIPWRSDKNNRLNPRNGLCLSTLHDKAFDKGLITIREDYTIKISSSVRQLANNRFALDWLIDLDGKKITLPEKFSPALEFIEWHNKHVFMRD